ncbi:MAG: bifunctional phosphoribosyl-AMP cyclohydrolase/phosphoribosyl-ATP diphosphatase HisIE [Firmicutes bacterium]|nr:bifunctional phosphoribosyl-AMP cyclohydrolase/phosphoribosyl-ATP diphosphatase HisIE [Bacillota bacterium]
MDKQNSPEVERDNVGAGTPSGGPVTAVDQVSFGPNGLVVVVTQDRRSGEVLMQAYANREALARTLAEGRAWYYSRSRSSLWLKGETSGHFQTVREVRLDCDGDAILYLVDQVGAACHEGYRSCFFRRAAGGGWEIDGRHVVDLSPSRFENKVSEDTHPAGFSDPSAFGILAELQELIAGRKREMPEGSYVTSLFNRGLDVILKKVGEEAAEVIIAGKGGSRSELVYELADLWFHCLVLLEEQGIDLREVLAELSSRRR